MKIFYSHFTLYGGPICAMTSTSQSGIQETAEIDQETANGERFHFFFKNCRNDSTETFYNHFALCGEHMCAMTLISYGRDLRNKAKIDQIRVKC